MTRAAFARTAVSAPGSAAEREADHAARSVLRGTDVQVRERPRGVGGAERVAEALAASGGKRLTPDLRAAMEPRFGFSFGDVRIHADAAAADTADRLGARAFAIGSHVGFAAGAYAPGRPAGLGLIAHELAHVVQGRGRSDVVMRDAAAPTDAVPHDRPVDVLEAIVHVMSNRGLAADFGEQGENVSSPRYASEVAKTVQEQEHKTLIWIWYLIATGDPVTHGDRAKIAEADAKTARLIVQAKADPSTRRKAAALAARYATGLAELSQRAAREQVDEMLEAGVDASKKAEKTKRAAGDEEQLKAAVGEAQKVMAKWTSVVRRTVSQSTTAKQTAALQTIEYRRIEASFLHDVEVGADPALPWPTIKRAAGMSLPDGIFLLQGGLDAASAILAVSDPKAREDLFKAKSNYFGTVAQGATINKVLWQFVSGTIAAAGAGAYAVTKLAGKATVAQGILDATVKGVSNVGAAINLAGVVHGAFVLADPDATSDEKAEAAVEVAYSAVGLAGFAARWTPRLAAAARWSGPISASLMINFQMVKWLAGMRHKAEVGLNRLDWVACHQATKAAAIEVQDWQRRLAVVDAILATEQDPRRKVELEKYAVAFRSELIERQLKPFVEERLASKGMDDDPKSCGRAFTKRLVPVQGMLASAAGSDDAALAASATFLLIVSKAFAEWDQIVMEKDPS
jgi:hypothetical protein